MTNMSEKEKREQSVFVFSTWGFQRSLKSFFFSSIHFLFYLHCLTSADDEFEFWMITLKAGFTAVSWWQDGVITVQDRTVLLYVLAVHLPKHLTSTTLLLPAKRERKTDTRVTLTLLNESSAFWCKETDCDSSIKKKCNHKYTYRFAEALDTVHDTKGLPKIWVPRVFQGVKSASKRASCNTNTADYTLLSSSSNIR